MIDLNRKKKQEVDTPVGAQILMILPIFIVLFWAMIRGL